MTAPARNDDPYKSLGLWRWLIALALLIAYLLLQIHIALKAHTTRVFQIAFGGVGGTEALPDPDEADHRLCAGGVQLIDVGGAVERSGPLTR